ncbi:MAG: PucR family transcriptional regulator ligand-binding domain-containing protein [Lachnospiraceae bacterium]|nr:PucR family transcriptional regulator ligand-binding domain-containing protein [Ruminococcus sp.]MCM1276467.1 PucR family transcriptional regulator ligand-binding domain-containing protein [Lachnospiraceae bacterium]
MAVTLRRLCRNAESGYGLKLAAGHNGMDNIVRWVHTLEESGTPDTLRGGELIFTTGIGYSENDLLLTFVKELKEHGAAGLVINLGQHIKSIPPQVLVYCNERDFPLLTLPREANTLDITYELCWRIIASEEQETSLAEALRGLIFGGEKREEYIDTLEQQGFDNSAGYTLIAASSQNEKTASAALKSNPALWKILRRSKNHTATFYQTGCAITVRQNTTEDDVKRIIAESSALDEYDLVVGISEKQEGFGALRDCYRQCISALSVGRITGRSVTRYNDIGIYKLIFGVEDKSVLRDYVNQILGELMKFDSSNDSGYIPLLKAYLENSGSVSQTSEQLGVHRNTVNYKLKSIREILGNQLDEESRMNLLLAFHVLEVLNLN